MTKLTEVKLIAYSKFSGQRRPECDLYWNEETVYDYIENNDDASLDFGIDWSDKITIDLSNDNDIIEEDKEEDIVEEDKEDAFLMKAQSIMDRLDALQRELEDELKRLEEEMDN